MTMPRFQCQASAGIFLLIQHHAGRAFRFRFQHLKESHVYSAWCKILDRFHQSASETNLRQSFERNGVHVGKSCPMPDQIDVKVLQEPVSESVFATDLK